MGNLKYLETKRKKTIDDNTWASNGEAAAAAGGAGCEGSFDQAMHTKADKDFRSHTIARKIGIKQDAANVCKEMQTWANRNTIQQQAQHNIITMTNLNDRG